MMNKVFAFSYITMSIITLSGFSYIKKSKGDLRKRATIETVVIDPGHGGIFTGTHGLISVEKNVNLEVGLKLGEAIKEAFPEINVVYTRTTDACSGDATNLRDDLQNRARIANEAKGDLFISIHSNATPQPAGGYYLKRVIGNRKRTVMVGRGKRKRKKTINEPIYESYWVKNTRIGTETYVWKAAKWEDKLNAINRNDKVSTDNMEDSAAEVSAFNSNSPEQMIRTQLYEKKFFRNSYTFSSMVEEAFKKSGRVSYGVKQRDVGIQVLQATGMPSILIEIGFLTNKEEEEYLNSNEGQDEVVSNIVAAFKKYKLSIDKKQIPENSGQKEN
jgi:N-acetylmuramoyl-L-alanine amidase